jgi:hypothetical protein
MAAITRAAATLTPSDVYNAGGRVTILEPDADRAVDTPPQLRTRDAHSQSPPRSAR